MVGKEWSKVRLTESCRRPLDWWLTVKCGDLRCLPSGDLALCYSALDTEDGVIWSMLDKRTREHGFASIRESGESNAVNRRVLASHGIGA